MIIGVIVDLAVGLTLIALGIVIWKKRKITLLHSYHYKNVKEADIPAYARGIGLGLCLVGGGICLTGILDLFYSPLWWVPLAAGIIAGIVTMHRTQKKYNGSWFA